MSVVAIDPNAVFEIMQRRSGKFFTLDNGGDAFWVEIQNRMVHVFSENKKRELLHVQNFDSLWLGCGTYDDPFDMSRPHYPGNTVLIQKQHTCHLVGTQIVKFALHQNEHIKFFVSTVGNAAVPYGFLITNQRLIIHQSNNCATGFVLLQDLAEDIANFDTFSELISEFTCFEDNRLRPMRFEKEA